MKITASKVSNRAVYGSSIDTNLLKSQIVDGIREYFSSPKGGWPEDEVDDAVRDYSVVEIKDTGDYLEVEVRAELGYDSMINLSEILDDIVRSYDRDSYFEMVCPGIMSAYIEKK